MRLLYLCMVGPLPTNSDFMDARDFFNSLPVYLQPNDGNNKSPHMCFFADRIGTDWQPEFFDFAIVFVSERFLNNEKALECLKYTSYSISNVVCIDLYNNLSVDSKKLLQNYSNQLFSTDEGKAFIITNFPQIELEYEEGKVQMRKSIENEGFKYLDNTIAELKDKEKSNKCKSYFCYTLTFLSLTGMMIFTLLRFSYINKDTFLDSISSQIVMCIGLVITFGVMIAVSRFLFLLGKSFMVESIRNSDRAHAIRFGKFYLQLYKDNFEWRELKDVLQNWNIDSGSAFNSLDSKDITPVKLSDIISSFKEGKNI